MYDFCFSLHKSKEESDRRNKSDQERLNKQMEDMAKLQNAVGDRESEAAALKKEIGKLRVSNEENRCVEDSLYDL